MDIRRERGNDVKDHTHTRTHTFVLRYARYEQITSPRSNDIMSHLIAKMWLFLVCVRDNLIELVFYNVCMLIHTHLCTQRPIPLDWIWLRPCDHTKHILISYLKKTFTNNSTITYSTSALVNTVTEQNNKIHSVNS